MFGRTKPAPAYIRGCTVYLSEQHQGALVAPMFNHAGLFAERPAAVVEGPLRDADLLGRLTRVALEGCLWQPEFNYRNRTPGEWPAFQRSGCRTIREFEATYDGLRVRGANEANLAWEVRSAAMGRFEVGMVGVVSAAAPDGEIGECLLAVWEAYRQLRKRSSTGSAA